jgi:glycogen(starch) synthase
VVHAHNWIVNSALGPARRRWVPVVLTLHDYSHVCATKRFVFKGALCPGPSPRRCASCSASHYGLAGPAIAGANWVAGLRRRRVVSEFLAVSRAVASASGLEASGVRYEVVPNFVPDAIISREPPLESSYADGPLLYAGDLSADKGVDVLLDAYRLLAGPPPLELAGRRVAGARLDLPPRASALGELAHGEVLRRMAAARLVVVPSIFPDPCPTVVLEAMANGRPVVASATGGIVDMLAGERCGRMVPPGDPRALAGAIEATLADPHAAAAMGREALERVLSYSESAVVGRIEACYERAVGRVSARRRRSG